MDVYSSLACTTWGLEGKRSPAPNSALPLPSSSVPPFPGIQGNFSIPESMQPTLFYSLSFSHPLNAAKGVEGDVFVQISNSVKWGWDGPPSPSSVVVSHRRALSCLLVNLFSSPLHANRFPESKTELE